MHIRPLEEKDLPLIKAFTDREIGDGYFSLEELKTAYSKSQKNGVMCSHVLEDENKKIHGLRLTYAPGQWQQGKTQHLRPDLWPVDLDEAGYFQSLFLSEQARGKNLGPKMSKISLERLLQLGAKAVVTHAWKESPNNSSLNYLKKFGFVPVIEHPLFWKDVDYVCTRDGKPCMCTAVEMIKIL